MINYDDTVKIEAPDAPRSPSAPLRLPASITAPQTRQAMPARSYEPVTPLDCFLLAKSAEQEFKLALIWIFIAIILSSAATTAFLIFMR